MESGIERIGQNIREAGMLDKQEKKSEDQSVYGINQTEAAAGTAAHAAYVFGRKLAQKQKEIKKLKHPKSISEIEPLNEIVPETPDINEVASFTVGVGVNPPEKRSYTVADEAIRALATAAKNELDKPLAGRLTKSKTAAERIKENKNKLDFLPEDKKTVRERQIYRVNPYVASTNISQDKSNDAAVRQALNRDIRIKNTVSPKTVLAEYPKVFTPTAKSTVEIAAEKLSSKREFAAKQSIKTRENQFFVSGAGSGKRESVSWEQGRKLAIKNLSEKKLLQRFDNINSDKQYVAPVSEINLPTTKQFLVQEQAISCVIDVGNINNQTRVVVQNANKLDKQQKIANIKTREYEKSRQRTAKSVHERSLGRQKLFGKRVYNDVKNAESSVDKSVIKDGLAGVKEKNIAKKAALDNSQKKYITYYKGVKYNGFGYFNSNHNNTKPKRIKQFVRRLIPNNAKEILAAVMGLGSVLTVVIIICLIASLFVSPFGIFFSGADTMSEAVSELNAEFAQRIEEIKADNTYNELVMSNAGSSAMIANWPDILAVYAVLTTMNDSNPYEAITLDSVKRARLREVFWAMNPISYEVRIVYDAEIDSEIAVLYISVAEKDCWQLADEYGFTAEQRQMLVELKKQEYQEMFMALVGSYQDINLTPEEIEEIIANLPADLSESRRQIVLTAYQLEGKVNYFWGGKSLTLGWDSRWGTSQEVWAAGSITTGTVRPFGLDCSGFVDWVFYNASNGSFIMGRGGGAASQHNYCRTISWSEAQPGDLVFYPDDSHVGIVCGFDSRGNVQIIHCAAGYNNVVVTGKSGFTAVGRPDYFID